MGERDENGNAALRLPVNFWEDSIIDFSLYQWGDTEIACHGFAV